MTTDRHSDPEILPQSRSATRQGLMRSGSRTSRGGVLGVAADGDSARGAEKPRLGASGRRGTNCFTLYLREIRRVRPLTAHQEIALAARIKKGDKPAREQVIRANLQLVVKIAREYEGLGLPLLDLISEGNVGLMKAIEHFDPKKRVRMSIDGVWRIKQAIKRALAIQSTSLAKAA